MKFFTNLFVFLFITFAAYLLLNEKMRLTTRFQTKKTTEITGTTTKIIGQIPTHDSSIFELQRQRIRSETIYKFQSNDTLESYELDESDLDKFGIQLIEFKNINNDQAPSRGRINDRKKKHL